MKKKLFILMIIFGVLYFFVKDKSLFNSDETFKNKIVLLANLDSGEILYENNSKQSYPVASMSKLMTYYVVMDKIENSEFGLDDYITIEEEDTFYNNSEYSNFKTTVGEELSIEELLNGLMIVSGNDAASILARYSSGTEEEFVEEMNNKASELKLKNSKFVNPTGITKDSGEYNRMSARDLFNLAKNIFEKYPSVSAYAKTRVLHMEERDFYGESTLPITKYYDEMIGLKTGYTEEAGYGFVGVFEIYSDEKDEIQRYVTVINGAKTPEERIHLTEKLIDKVKKADNR
ncbi:MAG: serine hydrolase [Tissierellia bacterium]|nr:serine hydrolase [Tissierellia bacterium]